MKAVSKKPLSDQKGVSISDTLVLCASKTILFFDRYCTDSFRNYCSLLVKFQGSSHIIQFSLEN
jgi:hypothetical protein